MAEKTKRKPAPKKPSPRKPAPKKKPSYETTEFNKLSGQVNRDLSAEKKKGTSASEENRLGRQINKDISAESALTEAGMGHPDAKALIASGIPVDRVHQLTQQYAPAHPAANAGTGFTETPTDPSQYAADVLKLGGLPDTASNEKLLETQMTEEGMPGGEDNPLATSLAMPGSSTVNSAGVQEYPSLLEGAQAEAATLGQSNMSSIYNALKSGTATPQQYAAALAGSSYEGNDPTANAAYANSYLADAGQPEQNFPTGGAVTPGSTTPGTGTQALSDAAYTNLFSNVAGNLLGSAGSQATNQSLQQALSGLSSSPEAAAETANTTQAPGSPDQSTSAAQKTATTSPAALQAVLAQLLPGITPGSAGKNG